MVRLNTVMAKNFYEFSLRKNQGTLLEGSMTFFSSLPFQAGGSLF